MSRRLTCVAITLMSVGLVAQTQQPAPQQPAANPSNLGSDANGNPLRRALKTGHVSNYDEAKVPPYTLPDPLVMSDGRRVTDAAMWRSRRRPEILRMYETDIYGRIPANTPKITWEVVDTDPAAKGNTAIMRRAVGRIGTAADGPRVNMMIYTPSKASRPVPLILLVNFGGGPPVEGRPPSNANFAEPPVAADILARGWGYAMVGYNDIQPDQAEHLQPGRNRPDAGGWHNNPGPTNGALSARGRGA